MQAGLGVEVQFGQVAELGGGRKLFEVNNGASQPFQQRRIGFSEKAQGLF